MKNEMRKALCDVMRVKAEHLRGIGITEKYCTQKDIDEIMTWEMEDVPYGTKKKSMCEEVGAVLGLFRIIMGMHGHVNDMLGLLASGYGYQNKAVGTNAILFSAGVWPYCVRYLGVGEGACELCGYGERHGKCDTNMAGTIATWWSKGEKYVPNTWGDIRGELDRRNKAMSKRQKRDNEKKAREVLEKVADILGRVKGEIVCGMRA
jgi:hypothetical protein